MLNSACSNEFKLIIFVQMKRFRALMQISKIQNTLCTGQIDSYASEGSEPITIFQNPIKELCRYLSRADVVFGCVYNLNHSELLESFRKTVSCQIITDRENLRNPEWYSDLPCIYSVDDVLNSEAHSKKPLPMGPYWQNSKDAIYIAKKRGTINMHNKYLVFCKINSDYCIVPQAVWTGSPNGTYNANLSYENAVYLPFQKTAIAYLKDYKRIILNSQGLSKFTQNLKSVTVKQTNKLESV